MSEPPRLNQLERREIDLVLRWANGGEHVVTYEVEAAKHHLNFIKLDGTIVTANENFCKALGFSLAEIEGKHHSLFMPPQARDSAPRRGSPAARREQALRTEEQHRGHQNVDKHRRQRRPGGFGGVGLQKRQQQHIEERPSHGVDHTGNDSGDECAPDRA
ncbi:MAG TPA: PAS domain S-box protein, partial [Candidatus Poseidoniales archaeon]|nr:PAS domain S-box protein [Candidatus Poseidoniales archaeon]